MRALPQGTRSDPLEGGCWWPLQTHGGRSAVVACPGCGRSQTLTGHTIAADGTVSPSLLCAYSCGFHDHVQLEDWNA